jgi:hypothetical protein
MSAEPTASKKSLSTSKAPSPLNPENEDALDTQPIEQTAVQALISAGAQPPQVPNSRPLGQAAIQRLQRQTGNRSVTTLLQKRGTTPEAFASQVSPTSLQRSEHDLHPLLNTDRDWIDIALRTKDSDDVKRVKDFESAEYDEKLTCLQILLKQSWYGPLDQLTFTRIWKSFPDPLEAAKFHITLWKKSVEAAPDLVEDVEEIAAEYNHLSFAFENDVLWIADSNLYASREIVLEEMAKYQVEETEDSMAEAKIPAEKVELLRAVQNAGHIVLRAQDAQNQIANYAIPYNSGEMGGYGDQDESLQNYDWLYAEESAEEGEVAGGLWAFDLNNPPPGENPDSYAIWLTLKENYERASGVIQEVLNQYPVLFPLLEAGLLERLTEQVDAHHALSMIDGRLSEVMENIDALRMAILPAIQDIDYRELQPIHSQLFAQGQNLDGVSQPWDESFYRWAAEKSIADFERSRFWMEFGLSLAEVGLLLFSGPLGLGAAGLMASLGIGALQAGISWERAEELATAADAAMRADLSVVSKEQASDATLQAVLDTVFLAIDALDLSGDLYKAGRRGAGSAGQTGAPAVEAAGGRMTSLKQALAQAPSDLQDDILDLYRKTGGFEAETVEILAENPDVLYRLLEQPRAASILRHCSDFCFPPNVTEAQLDNLERVLGKLESSGVSAKALREYLYLNQKDLDWAIHQVEESLDEYLVSGVRPSWFDDATGSLPKGAKKGDEPGVKGIGGAGADMPAANYSGLSVSVFWQAGENKVYLTQANQLIGSHRSLIAFRAAHKKEYARWHSHHIIEEVHLKNLGIRSSFPGRDDLPCVLLPRKGHSGRLRTILGQADTLKLSKAELYEYYEEAYDLLGDYSGANGVDELLTIVKKMLDIQ